MSLSGRLTPSSSHNNNNETFKLLDVTSPSDSEPELLQLELPQRKRRVYRSRRNRNHDPPPTSLYHDWAPRALTLTIAVLLVAWLVALSWAAASLYADTKRLDASLREEKDKISMRSEKVEDDLQKCHSSIRELQHNQSEMATKLDELYVKMDNLTQQVIAIQSSLLAVKQQVASAPELTSMPQQLSAMESSVARFGSQIKDLDSRVSILRTQTGTITDGQNNFIHNITDINDELVRLWNKTMLITNQSTLKDLEPVKKKQDELQALMSQITANLTIVNKTLLTQIEWATQDFKNDHHKVIGLLESVQNNSAAVSSLQTAWHQNNEVINEIISRNLTEIHQRISDKEAEIQRHNLEIKELKEIIDSINKNKETTKNTVPLLENPNPLPQNSVSQESLSSDVKTLHERDSGDMLNMPKINITSSTPSSLDLLKRTDLPKSDSGKPNILSSGSA